MATVTVLSTFLQLARELRDQIYDDALRFTTTGNPPESLPPHVVDVLDTYSLKPAGVYRFSNRVKWRLSPNRGTCFGLMHSCRQVYKEMLESIDRQDGVSFQLDLIVLDSRPTHRSSLDGNCPILHEEIWAEWVVLPICTYIVPNLQPLSTQTPSLAITHSKCKNLHVSFRIQCEHTFRWRGDGGPAPLTQNLFSMLAKLLLHGPWGLQIGESPSSDSDSKTLWNIDTLSVDIIGSGTTFTNPYDGQHYTIPTKVVENTEQALRGNLMGTLCLSGALSGRVRVVRLLVDGELKHECVVDQTMSLSAATKSEWARYGSFRLRIWRLLAALGAQQNKLLLWSLLGTPLYSVVQNDVYKLLTRKPIRITASHPEAKAKIIDQSLRIIGMRASFLFAIICYREVWDFVLLVETRRNDKRIYGGAFSEIFIITAVRPRTRAPVLYRDLPGTSTRNLRTRMATVLVLSSFLQLARELRDQIYDDALRFTIIGNPPESLPPHVVDVDGSTLKPAGVSRFSVRWRLPPNRGTCFGLMYSCRQVYEEMLESIDRQDGVSFELDLIVLAGRTHRSGLERIYRIRHEEIWAEWVVLPICTYIVPNVPLLSTQAPSLAITHSKCKNLYVSFRIQCENSFRWSGDGGPAPLTQNLFSMLAKFLLHGPWGLQIGESPSSDSDSKTLWNIDTLSVDIIGSGTTFTNPYDGQHYTVPTKVVENTEQALRGNLMGTLCLSGALSGRVRVVRLLVDGELKHECVVDQTMSLSAATKSEWALYGVTIGDEIVKLQQDR
ncbi:hypothetical protein BT96DRAFT_973187 [Gymnopus androsaceus JB14]|uniref:Uncharacterized protein n=1 Tax=Gymnopus androsaceus JB14 TaxID=1447944 RepID=A0A6A4I695_9AGAR|nr:hypothetical protein BT96DRAFT_973187 [Gymnopus androsaceus JB14]